VAVLIILVGALAIWNFYLRPPFEPASVEKMAYPLPDKPSIAVLPFTNMSGDREQEYFSDGITDLIITQLFKIPDMFVISKTSSFVYKGKAVRIQQVAEELGVRYVLEGSVQKSGERIRISAQLIDALTGRHLWAERYDRELKDMFAVQDEIVRNVVTELAVQMTQGEWARRMIHASDNYEAVDYYLRADKELIKFEKEANVRGRELLMKAVELDPNYARAIAYLGYTYYYDVFFGWAKSPAESFRQAQELAERAVATKENDYLGHGLLSRIYAQKRNYEESIAAGKRAMEVEPSNSNAMAILGGTLNYAGRPAEALTLLKKAMRHTPYPPSYFYFRMGDANYLSGQYEAAITEYEKLLRRQQHGRLARSARQWLIASYMELGREEEARSEADKFMEQDPKICIEALIKETKRAPYKDYTFLDRQMELLRKVGIPETPPLPLPDKPSIAVLPFVNMSGDPEQEYFSDGITESIITGLSKTPRLFVIARNSTFTYKGKPTNVQKVGRELGVRYVLEGSVQKSGDRVRITAQLVDAKSGNHVWAERYDRDLKDIFTLQDEITMNVIKALELRLTEGEQALVYGRGTNNLEAYLKFLQAIEYARRQNPDDNQKAKRIFKEAIGLDPNYAVAYRLLGATHMMDAWLGTTKNPRESLRKAAELSRKALALDESLGTAYAMLGHIYILTRNYDKGLEVGQKAVELEPNGADSHAFLGMGLRFADRPEEAIKILKKAIRLNPMPQAWYLHNLASANRNLGRYDEAVGWAKKAVERQPSNVLSRLALVSCYSLAGREEEAKAEAEQVLRINPKFSLERLAKTWPQKNQEVKKSYIDSLRKAGLK
jgi:TolB-like protein/cytochrome c-type biogenesis protein CcmH/NrfG